MNLGTCKKILQSYQRGNKKLLEVELDEAAAAIYDNDMSGQHMAAFNGTICFVGLVDFEADKKAPPEISNIKRRPGCGSS